jgi:dTDP-4-dehydrorhamnose reductase
MEKRLLITGGSGLLGQYLNKIASEKNKILTLFHNQIGNCSEYNNIQVDLRNNKKAKEIFSGFKPEIVIHTAAHTNPILQSNQDPTDIYDINVNATKYLAELCDKYNSKLIYISTDLVYAGYRGSMLEEDAKIIPVSLYAETKLMGEMIIKETFNHYLILRTALLYGFGLNHSRCHFHNMYENLKSGISVNLFTDQYRTPISLLDAARIIVYLADENVTNETINVAGIERVSRFELGEILCKVTGFDKSLLNKITLNDIPELPKVEDVSLKTDKLKSFGVKINSIERNILQMLGH